LSKGQVRKALAKKKILIAEDEHVVAEDLRQTLTDQGYDVVGVVYSGEQAIAEAREIRPDLVVMDIVLSGSMDGISAAQQLRPLGIPVIYLTGYSDGQLLDRAKRTEPLAYVMKPAKSGELAAALQIAFFKAEQQRNRVPDVARNGTGIHEADEQFRLMVAGVSDYSIFTLDADGKVNSWNRGAERKNGYSAEEIMGRSYDVLFTAKDREQGVPLAELEIAREHGKADDTRWLVRKNGELFWAEGTLTGIRNESGVVTGFAKITRDATERKQMQEALLQSEERLRIGLQAARMGTWHWEIPGDIDTLDESLRRLFGIGPDYPINSIEDFYALIHEEDRTAVRAAFEKTRNEGVHLATEFRVVRPDGTERWFLDHGEVFSDAQGRPLYMTGACVDITERMQAERKSKESEERFRLFVANVRDYALFQLDADGRIVTWNSGAESLLGFTADEIIGQPTARIFVPEDVANGQPQREIEEAKTSGRAIDERWHMRKDGTCFWCSGVLTSVRDEEGHLRGFAKVMKDETERRNASERLMASLEEKEVLLKEIHHRVKNNLQVITSLLSLQSNAVQDETVRQMFDEACNRVRSIGDIHELLYRSPDLAHVDFDTYINRLAEYLLSFYDVSPERVHLNASAKVQLNLSDAISCGLIVNELLTNALKHAFPQDRAGSIQISLTCQDGECVLEVADDGVGLPENFRLEEATSLGLKLVSVLAKQLQGTVRLQRIGGTRVTLEFPQADSEKSV
jgi:PAS domain S-box-containing protein